MGSRAPLYSGAFLWLIKYSMLYKLYTLVDISATGQLRGGNSLERHQQQNFDTVLQTIGLKGNVYYDNKPIIIPGDIFGNEQQRCWYFEWTMELDELFLRDGDPIAELKEIFEYVPFIPNLTETASFDKPFFKLGQNIIFDFRK